jgi:hypothetical protein
MEHYDTPKLAEQSTTTIRTLKNFSTKNNVIPRNKESPSTINRQPSTNELHPPPHRLLRQNPTGRTPEPNTYQFVFSIISVLEYQPFPKPD